MGFAMLILAVIAVAHRHVSLHYRVSLLCHIQYLDRGVRKGSLRLRLCQCRVARRIVGPGSYTPRCRRIGPGGASQCGRRCRSSGWTLVLSCWPWRGHGCPLRLLCAVTRLPCPGRTGSLRASQLSRCP